MKRFVTEFFVLPAYHGDCILIKTFDPDNNEFIILIDGGTSQTFKYSLKKELEDISYINILILTHIDSDHIAGLIAFFNSTLINEIRIDEIWLNNPDMIEIDTGNLISVKQGDTLKTLISQKSPNSILRGISTEDGEIDKCGINFLILSPTPNILNTLYESWKSQSPESLLQNNIGISSVNDDYTKSLVELSQIPFITDKGLNNDIFNASSIAFMLKCPDVSILLLADARPEIIEESLIYYGFNEQKPIVADYVKISHHGSLNNTSQAMLSLIKSDNFIISTNGGTANHRHPSRETIGRIVHNSNRSDQKLNIYFNYNIDDLRYRIGDFINDADLTNGNWDAEHRNNF